MRIKNFSEIKSFFLDNKGLRQTILKNTFWLTISEVISKGISFFLLIWIAGYFGPNNYGKIAFSLSFVAIFAFFIDFGFTSIAIREISRDKSKSSKYIENILAIELILGLVTFGFIFISTYFLGKGPEVSKLIYLFGISTILDCFTLFFQSVFCANEKMEYVAVSRFIQGISLLGLIVFLIIHKSSIIVLGYAFIVASIISAVSTLFITRSFFSKFFPKINFDICKEIIKEAWPVGLINFAALMFQSFGSVLLGFFRSNREVGLYSAASRITLGTYFLSTILFSAFIPSISRAFKENYHTLKNIIEKYALLNFCIGIPIGIGGFIIAPQLIRFLYGDQYLGSIIPFQILSLNLIFIFMVAFYGQTLIFFDKQKRFLKSYVVGLIVNIILNILLIPKFGVIGAAITALATQCIILGIVFSEFRKIIKFNLKNIFLSSLMSSILMVLFIVFVNKLGLNNTIFSIILGACVYFLILCSIFWVVKRCQKNVMK